MNAMILLTRPRASRLATSRTAYRCSGMPAMAQRMHAPQGIA